MKILISKRVSKFIVRAISENHRIWGTGVGGWGATKSRRLIYRERFWVDGGNQIWRNCYECEEEESSTWWEQLQQNYENQSMCGHVEQPTDYSLMMSCTVLDNSLNNCIQHFDIWNKTDSEITHDHSNHTVEQNCSIFSK